MNNSGIKVMLVILIIVCVFQGCMVASLTSGVEELRDDIASLEQSVDRLKWQIEDLEEQEAENGILKDVSYGVEGVDWEEGKIYVNFTISLAGVTDNTVATINNELETVTLSKSGGQFVGTIGYPIDNGYYETKLCQYDGDSLVASEIIYWLDAQSLLAKYILCDFSGFASYGNERLTLAGEVNYTINVEDKVTQAKLVFEDEETTLSDYSYGTVEINSSKTINGVVTDSRTDINSLYLEVITESGVILRVYPEIYISTNHKVDTDVEVNTEMISPDASQECVLEVITPSGKTYRISIIA